MPRKVNAANDTAKAKAGVPKTKATRKDGMVVFRSPSPGLEVLIEQSVLTDRGGGAYSITQPKMAKFENMGNYGELVCSQEVAKVLRQKAKDRVDRHLPPKFMEVEQHA